MSENKPPSVVSVRLAFIGTLNLPTHFMKQHSHHLTCGAIIIIRVLKLTGVSLGAAFLHTFRMSRWTTCIHQKIACYYKPSGCSLCTWPLWQLGWSEWDAMIFHILIRVLTKHDTCLAREWGLTSPLRSIGLRIEFRLSIYMHFTCLAPLTQRRSC